MTTENELMAKILLILPNAIFYEGLEGELVVYTGMKVDRTNNNILESINEGE